MSLPERENPK